MATGLVSKQFLSNRIINEYQNIYPYLLRPVPFHCYRKHSIILYTWQRFESERKKNILLLWIYAKIVRLERVHVVRKYVRKMCAQHLKHPILCEQIVVKYWSFSSVSWIIYYFLLFVWTVRFFCLLLYFQLCYVLYTINRFRTVHFINQYSSVRTLCHTLHWSTKRKTVCLSSIQSECSSCGECHLHTFPLVTEYLK